MAQSNRCSCLVCKLELPFKGLSTHIIRNHTPNGNWKIPSIKCSCIICRKEVGAYAIKQHYIKCTSPKVYKTCCNCGIQYSGDGVNYCSRACSTKITNKYSKHTAESKEKLSKINKSKPSGIVRSHLEGTYIPKSELVTNIYRCNDCGKYHTKVGVKYCSSCRPLHNGGLRNGSGKSKSGYYKGVYCGSTYELAWVIYNIDNNIHFSRFEGYITYDNNSKYYPDFIIGDTIYEMKGWTTKCTDLILLKKCEAAKDAGYNIKVLFKEDLGKEFDWVKRHYTFSKMEELYEGYKPKYSYTCSQCGVENISDVKKKTTLTFCNRSCAGSYRTLHRVKNGS